VNSFTTVRAGENYHVATWDRVLIEVLMEGVTIEALKARLDAHRKLYDKYPDRVLSLSVVPAGVNLPDSELRKESGRVVKMLAPRTQVIVVVLEGEGFWASAARSALTGIQLLAPGSHPMKVVRSVSEGCRLMAQEAGETLPWAQKLEQVVEQIRSGLGQATRAAF
jgi:hypothetical protein